MRHLTRPARTTSALAAAALLLAGCGIGGTEVDAETASSGSDTVAPEPTEGREGGEDGGASPPRARTPPTTSPPTRRPATDGPVVDDESEPQASDGALPPAAPTGDPVVSVEGTPPWSVPTSSTCVATATA